MAVTIAGWAQMMITVGNTLVGFLEEGEGGEGMEDDRPRWVNTPVVSCERQFQFRKFFFLLGKYVIVFGVLEVSRTATLTLERNFVTDSC